jgi:hypothetical protein
MVRKKHFFALEERREAAAESRERRRDASSAFQSPTLPSRVDLAKLPLVDLCSSVPDTSFSSSCEEKKKLANEFFCF